MSEINILFCCKANICRSPMAEGLFRKLVSDAGLGDRICIDSAGTHADYPDHAPDRMAQKILKSRGVDISDLRARPITQNDFERFDLILVMDGNNYDMLRFICPKRSVANKISLIMDYVPKSRIKDIPDPVNGEESDFEQVADLLEMGTLGLLGHIQSQIG